MPDGTSPAPAWAGRRVALVHDWLTGMRGGERVLESLCRLFPDAPLYTLAGLAWAARAWDEPEAAAEPAPRAAPGA